MSEHASGFTLLSEYATLPDAFYARVDPTPVAKPALLHVNAALARELGLDPAFLGSEAGLEILSGNRVPDDASPLAMVYGGHQFGHWVPRLGDGRAVLLGEVVDQSGQVREVQLKGAGRTPFSRQGDGRAGLGPVMREYLLSEAMAALGIPTTRSLAMVATGEAILREQPEPGAILTRVARSHVRVGTFQYFHHRGEREAVRTLADHVIERIDPAESDEPYRKLLRDLIERQARLVAQWMLVGFIHGVMNTDNTAISGETIDYGPCAFLDEYDPKKVFSSIDQQGRYAYGNQPAIAHWNLYRFAETLLPWLAPAEEDAIAWAEEALGEFPRRFAAHYEAGLLRKIGIVDAREGDLELAQELLDAMAAAKADFTATFRGLATDAIDGDAPPLVENETIRAWKRRWQARMSGGANDLATAKRRMGRENPAVIPRNHQVERAIRAAVDQGRLGPFEELLAALASPFEVPRDKLAYADPPEPHERVTRTFCGT